jgi:hypothetical protein
MTANTAAPKSGSLLKWRVHLMRMLLMAQFAGTIAESMKDTAKRRLAAAALAVRLYENDTGRLPATLDKLVPEYLPFVPVDLCSAKGEPILYFPDGPNARVSMRPAVGTRSRGGAAGVTAGEGQVFWIYGEPAQPAQSAPASPRGSEEDVHKRDGVEHEVGDAGGDQAADDQP